MPDRAIKTELFDEFARAAQALASGRRVEIVFQGEADHAGTTPIALRHDALVAASHTVASVRRLAEQFAVEGPDYFVATVGILTVDPSAATGSTARRN